MQYLFYFANSLFAASSQQYFFLTSNQHQPPASSNFLSQQINTSHQPQHSETDDELYGIAIPKSDVDDVVE